jgi:hypothetical protein
MVGSRVLMVLPVTWRSVSARIWAWTLPGAASTPLAIAADGGPGLAPIGGRARRAAVAPRDGGQTYAKRR